MKTLKIILIICLSRIMIAQTLEINVTLMESKTIRQLENVLKEENSNLKVKGLKQCYPNSKNLDLRKCLSFSADTDGGNKAEIRNYLENLKMFESISFEERVYLATCPNPEPPVNDSWIVNNWANNYALEMIEANCAWSITHGSSDIVVGVADTEFETMHPDLTNQINTVLLNNSTGGNPHGTRVSGAVCAETNNSIGISGIGYNTKLALHSIPHDASGGTSSSSIRTAIWNLYLSGEVDIINVSWTGTGLSAMATQEIVDAGIVLVVAAGNTPNSISHSSIANIPGVILVSSVNSSNEHGSSGHAHNQWIDVCAPGVNVTTTKEVATYGGEWGTSIAAPIVAGTIALMKSVNPCLSPYDLELMIEQSCDPISDASNFPNQLGSGRINAYKAVKRAGTAYVQNETINSDKTISIGYQIFVGNNVTNEISTGDVLLTSGNDMVLKAHNEITLDAGFTMELGSSLEIDVNPNLVLTCP